MSKSGTNVDAYVVKGSSRSRDRDRYRRSNDGSSDEEPDIRKHKHKYEKSRERSRSNERDKKNKRSKPDAGNSKSKNHGVTLSGYIEVLDEYEEDTKVREMSISPQREEAEAPTPPPPPRISKIKMGFNKPQPIGASTIKMNLNAPKSQPLQKKPSIASVFNTSDDEEPEEMPAEARMRMRNIGRETPTSAGPNSFGKTKQGFCDSKRIFEKKMKEAMESVSNPNPAAKLPNTIYKL